MPITAIPDHNLERNYQRKVLLVEDNIVNQLLIEKYLLKLGIEVVIVENGLRAINTVVKDDFHLILMDLEMPILGGIDATKQIRGKKLSLAPIIALTAHDDEATRRLCKESKMNGHLIKPLRLGQLVKQLDKYFN